MNDQTSMPTEWRGKDYPFDFDEKRYIDLERASLSSFGEDDEPVPRQSFLSRRTKLIVLGIVLLFVSGATAGGLYGRFGERITSSNGVLAADNVPSSSEIESSTQGIETSFTPTTLDTSSTATTSPIPSSSSSSAGIVTVALLQQTAAPTPTSTPSSSSSSLSEAASSSPSPSAAVVQTNDASLYMTQTYHGVATHFPGSQLPTAALACGDAYTHPATTLFAALCKSTFDTFPGTTSTALLNSNKSPVCGAYVAGRKGIDGNWIERGNGVDWAVVGGDGALSCVGTESVRCHIPRTITITHGSTVIKNVMIVDRNQGLGGSPCSPGDVDASDEVYRILAGTTTDDANAGLGINVTGISWVWE